jgi:hypothetical protein
MIANRQESGLRKSLVTALVSCADTALKAKARRFLRGLSSDELQFIAEYLGSCILEARQVAILQEERGSKARLADQEHKMIVLLEYLHRSGVPAANVSPSRHAVN